MVTPVEFLKAFAWSCTLHHQTYQTGVDTSQKKAHMNQILSVRSNLLPFDPRWDWVQKACESENDPRLTQLRKNSGWQTNPAKCKKTESLDGIV